MRKDMVLGAIALLVTLAPVSLKADTISIGVCTTANCTISPSDYVVVGGASPIVSPLPAGQSATDKFLFPSFAEFGITGEVSASNVLNGTGLGTTLDGGVSFTLDVQDLLGQAGALGVIVQQTLATPSSNAAIIDGTSFLQGTMNPAAVTDGATVTAGVQSGGYPIGNFSQGPALSFSDTSSGGIPGYAADGFFYEQVIFNFGADASHQTEDISIPLGGNTVVPDPQGAAVPEPTALVLLLSGLAGTGSLWRRRR